MPLSSFIDHCDKGRENCETGRFASLILHNIKASGCKVKDDCQISWNPLMPYFPSSLISLHCFHIQDTIQVRNGHIMDLCISYLNLIDYTIGTHSDKSEWHLGWRIWWVIMGRNLAPGNVSSDRKIICLDPWSWGSWIWRIVWVLREHSIFLWIWLKIHFALNSSIVGFDVPWFSREAVHRLTIIHTEITRCDLFKLKLRYWKCFKAQWLLTF